jgi:outer membrane protein assembly factor BamB
LEMQSGNVLWQQTIAWDLLYRPVLSENGNLFFTDGRGLYRIRSSDGEILWQQVLRLSSADVVDVTPDLVAIIDPPYLEMYQTLDGSLLWKKSVCRQQVQAYFYDTNIVVPCFGLTSMNAVSGEFDWETKPDEALGLISQSAYANGVIYFSQDGYNITAYDLQNRDQLWMVPWEKHPSQTFKVAGDYLLATKYNRLCVLNRYEGKISWCDYNLKAAKDPVIFEGVLYLFNGLQAGITAYDIHNGSLIGRLDFPSYNVITVDYYSRLMVPSEELLIFAHRNKIYAYRY